MSALGRRLRQPLRLCRMASGSWPNVWITAEASVIRPEALLHLSDILQLSQDLIFGIDRNIAVNYTLILCDLRISWRQ